MKVYRLFNQKELEGYEKGDLSEVGVEYENSDFLNINTHEYKEGVRYLHFFKHKEDIQFAEKLKKDNVKVILNETKKTMHGFEIKNTSITKKCMNDRINFINNENID